MTMNICFNCGLLSGKDAQLYAFVSSFVKDYGMTQERRLWSWTQIRVKVPGKLHPQYWIFAGLPWISSWYERYSMVKKYKVRHLIPKKRTISVENKNKPSVVFFFLDKADHRCAGSYRPTFHSGHLRPPAGRRSGHCPAFFTGGGGLPPQPAVVRYLSFPSILYFNSAFVSESDHLFLEPVWLIMAPI